MTKIQKLTLAMAAMLGLVTLAPAFVAAQTGAAVNTSVGATAPAATVSATASVKLTAAQTTAVQRADKEIQRRITALTALDTRVQAMQQVTAAFKQNLSANIQTEVQAFTALQAKVDADTDAATLKTDVQSITSSYRVFALVIPQGRISAAADRVVTIVAMMSTLGSKLQARVQAAQQAGNNVSVETTALTDMGNKLADAQTQAQAAVNAVAPLVPDNGDKTKMASNDAALKEARSDIAAAVKDLQAARKDVTTIVNGLKTMQPAAAASSTTQVQTTTP